jgi:hypothetical protein
MAKAGVAGSASVHLETADPAGDKIVDERTNRSDHAANDPIENRKK